MTSSNVQQAALDAVAAGTDTDLLHRALRSALAAGDDDVACAVLGALASPLSPGGRVLCPLRCRTTFDDEAFDDVQQSVAQHLRDSHDYSAGKAAAAGHAAAAVVRDRR